MMIIRTVALMLLAFKACNGFSTAPLLGKPSHSSLSSICTSSSSTLRPPTHSIYSKTVSLYEQHQQQQRPTALGWHGSQIYKGRSSSSSMKLYAGSNKFLTTVISGAVLVLFVGIGLAPVISGISNGTKSQSTVKVLDDDGNISERGVFTSMTMYEINRKLSQLPVFFAKTTSGDILLTEDTGKFFMSPIDAKAELDKMVDANVPGAKDAKVAATSLNDVYFPLIVKNIRRNKPIPNVGAGIAVRSNLKANYVLVPEKDEVEKAKQYDGWTGGDTGVPIFMAEKLAFGSANNVAKIKVPLFASFADLESSWKKLDSENPPTVTVGTIGDAVARMEKGGVEARMLEFFADVDAIEQAENLYTAAPGAE